MGAAAAGFITPVQGALFQEAIDVAVILNALKGADRTTRSRSMPHLVSRAPIGR